VRRQIVSAVVITLVAAGCGTAPDARGRLTSLPLQVVQSPTPFDEVAAGPVHALVPDRWRAEVARGAAGDEGFFASPRPRGWQRMDGSVAGMAATWVDVSRIGVPSDYYYLAANGPVLQRLTHSAHCRADTTDVIVNHRPAYFRERGESPGDYVARAEGRCSTRSGGTRWAYFVAAPGYGPVRRVGIPSSGLYVVVAVLRDSRGAATTVRRLVDGARFGDAGVPELIAAAAGRVPAAA
jgi:hypothetical protein